MPSKYQNSSSEKIAQEISMIMPVVARKILMDFFKDVEISQSQIFLIMTLDECEPCRLSSLSHKMNISSPTTSGLIDRLEKSGYVNRSIDLEDRRAINIVLTTHGKTIAKKLRTSIKNRWAEILGKLTVNEGEQYVKILRKIKDVI